MTSDAAINKHIKELEGGVDLLKLEIGYTVKFLCGGQAEIKNVFDHSEHRINLIFKEEPNHKYNYMLDGSATGAWGPRVFDIIEIIPAAFDWDTVKPGMCFTTPEDGNAYYCYNTKGGPNFSISSYDCPQCQDFYKELIHVPQHDIEVPG